MTSIKTFTRNNLNFFETNTPKKITESSHLKLKLKCWSLITEFYIESVKINCYKPNQFTSTAVIKIGDASGQVTGIVKGPSVGILFGLSPQEWMNIEKLCDHKQQLFYRYFRNGLSINFKCEQKVFYEFCKTNQTQDVLAVIYCRGPNLRTKDNEDAVIQILEISKANTYLIHLYSHNLNKIV